MRRKQVVLKRLYAVALNLATSLTLFTAAVDVVLGAELGLHPLTTPDTWPDLDNFRSASTNSNGRCKDDRHPQNDRSEPPPSS